MRIQRLADEMSYRPNPLISALMSYQRAGRMTRPKHLSLAMVINFTRRGPWRTYVAADLLAAAATRAAQHGYGLEEFWLGDLKMTGQRLSQVLNQRSVPGIIVAPLPVAHGHLRLEWGNFSAVAVGHSLCRPVLHRVTTNRFQAMRLAVRQLRRKGYERLGLALNLNQDARVDHQWGAAFLWEQQRIKPAQRVVSFIMPERQWTERNFAQWFEASQPEAILGYDPIIISWLKRLGKRVPQDVGFAHLWALKQSGEHAGLYHSAPAIAAAAVDLLVALIQRNERGVPSTPQTVLVEASWTDGASVKSLRAT